MTDLRKAAEDLLEVVEAAIKAGDWKVDGACDLDLAIVRLRQALAQPELVGLTEDEFEAILESHNEAFPFAVYKSIETKLKEKNKREWVGLTDEDLKPLCNQWKIMYGGYVDDFARVIEAKLKEKNT